MKIVMDAKKNDAFINALEVIGELISDELTLKLPPEGPSVEAMDAANVAMVTFKYKKEAFDTYETKTDQQSITVKFSEFKTRLKRMKGVVTIEDKDNVLTISGKETSKNKNYTMPLIDNTSEETRRQPNLQYPGTLTMKSDALRDAMDDVELAGATVQLSTKDNALTISANDETKGSATVDVTTTGTLSDEKSKYSIEYLQKIATTKLTPEVEVKFKTNYPLTIEYKHANYEAKFVLAPRVDND